MSNPYREQSEEEKMGKAFGPQPFWHWVGGALLIAATFASVFAVISTIWWHGLKHQNDPEPCVDSAHYLKLGDSIQCPPGATMTDPVPQTSGYRDGISVSCHCNK